MSSVAPMRVDVFSDVVCPWCFIGHARLKTALEATGHANAVVVHHPFLLNEHVPDDGYDLRDYLRSKYGGDPERMFRGVEEAARSAGVPLDFSRVTRMPSSVKAHALLRRAEDAGNQLELLNEFFKAYFLEGADVGDDDVLVNLSLKHGLPEVEARAIVSDVNELEQTRIEAFSASSNGITGVPFFVFNEALAFSGAQPDSVFRDVIEKAVRRLN